MCIRDSGNALLALLQALAHAQDDLQAGIQSSQSALVDGLVGLCKVLAALGVADDDVLLSLIHISAEPTPEAPAESEASPEAPAKSEASSESTGGAETPSISLDVYKRQQGCRL